jgi:uncharacterized membrane protein
MTIGDWLTTRTPAPPPQLLRRVRNALGDATQDDARLAPERCLDAAERVVMQLLCEGRTGRDSAADLLTADALVTYAFEAAGENPASLGERAQAAMVRLARIGTTQATAAPGSSTATAIPGRT